MVEVEIVVVPVTPVADLVALAVDDDQPLDAALAAVIRGGRGAELAAEDDDQQHEKDGDGEPLEAAVPAEGALRHGGDRTGSEEREGRDVRAAQRMSYEPSPLAANFFARPTPEVARDLLGRYLVYRSPDDGRLVGRVVETEAYTKDDPAMHGWKATFGTDGRVRPTGRAADLFAAPGTAYVYKIYYAHWLLNVVTEPEGTAGAVLIRALEPIEGEAAMTANRPASIRRRRDLTNGPGKLTQALGIGEAPDAVRSRFHGTDLTAPPLYFAEGEPVPAARVATSSRIGISRGIDRPYRFFLPDSAFVSPGEPSDVRLARKTKRA